MGNRRHCTISTLHEWYFSPNVVREKSRRVNWAGHAFNIHG
jgi:hypothetical protein